MVLVEKITVSAGKTTLTVGESTSVCATVSPNTATNKNVSWESSDEKVAAVNGNTIIAYKAGSAVIKAIAKDASGQYGSLTITVKAPVPIGVSSISLNRATLSLEEGEGYGLVATVSPSSAANKDIEWSSSNPSVASVDVNGYVCARGKGNAVILATSEDNCNAKACCTVTVTGDTLVTSVSVNPSNITLQVGKSQLFNATVCPPDATNKKVTWCSSKPSVASVHSDTGKVYANNIGTARIYATATDGTEKFGYGTVTVTPVYTQKLTSSKSEMTIYKGEYAYPPQIIRTPAEPTDPSLHWCSDNDDIVEVNCQDGCLYAKNTGTARIYVTAKDGSNKRTYFTVTVLDIDGISVSPDSITLTKIYQTRQLVAHTVPTNRTINDVVWSSSDKNIVIVDQDGVVTAMNNGTATITATNKENREMKSNCIVTVDNRETIRIDKSPSDKYYDDFLDEYFTTNKQYYSVFFDSTESEEFSDTWHIIAENLSEEFLEDKKIIQLRANENAKNKYSSSQLAQLFIIDPLGVAYYMKNYTWLNGVNLLFFKDEIYYKIFGRNPNLYAYDDPTTPLIYSKFMTADKRNAHYSTAELIFGAHLIPLNYTWPEFTVEILGAIISNLPVVSEVIMLYDACEALFMAKSFDSVVQGGVDSFTNEYIKTYLHQIPVNKLTEKICKWSHYMPNILSAVLDVGGVIFERLSVPASDLCLYRSINAKNFNIKFIYNGKEISLQTIIDNCDPE